MTMTRRVAYYCGQGARVLLFFYLLFCISSCGGGGGSTTSTPTGTVTGTVTLPANTNAKLFKAPQSFYARLFASPAHAEAVTDLTKLIVTASGATTNPNSSGKYTLTVSEGTNLELTVTAPSGNVVLQAIIPSVTAGSSTSQNVDSTSTAVALLWKSNTNLSLSQIQSLPAFTTVKNAVESALTDVVVDSISANTSVTSAVQTAVTPALTTITLSPSSVTLISGTSQTFTATGLDQYGNILSFTPTLSVTPSGLGSITSSGAFTALKTGTGTITVTGGGISASAAVTVTTGALNSLVISPTSVTLYKNDTQQFTVYGTDTNGNAKERKFITVSSTWSVTGSIGTVDSNGFFSASTQGTGQVKAETIKSDGTAVSITSDVTISNRNPSVSVSASSSNLVVGESTTITASASDADNDTLTYSWTATGGTLSGSGSSVTYTASLPGGTYTISVTVSDSKGGTASGSVTMLTNSHPVITSGPTASPGSITAFSSTTVSVTASDADNDTLTYTWSVSGGTFSGTSTYTAPYSPGTYTIRVTVSDSKGGIASGSTNVTVTPVAAKLVSTGWSHTCAVTTSGGVKCWGIGASGELGNGVLSNSIIPVDVFGLSSGVTAIATGGTKEYSAAGQGSGGHTCALTTSGSVKCWGRSDWGQAGLTGNCAKYKYCTTTPWNLSISSDVTAIAAIGLHTCALTSSGSVTCWGRYGGTPPSSDIMAIAANCAVTTSGGVKCWFSSSTAVDDPGLSTGVTAVETGIYHACALTTSGGVKCWGANNYGQLGNGTTTSTSIPIDVTGLSSGVTAIAAGDFLTCAVTTSGGVKCWGMNNFGQLGNGTDSGPEMCASVPCSTIPVDVTGLSSGITAIAAGTLHACAVTSSGVVKCWGENGYGQLGNGTTTNSNTPVSVVGFGG